MTLFHHVLYFICQIKLYHTIPYDIVNSDWSQNIDILYSKVELYLNRLMNINHKCTESVIRELCKKT